MSDIQEFAGGGVNADCQRVAKTNSFAEPKNASANAARGTQQSGGNMANQYFIKSFHKSQHEF